MSKLRKMESQDIAQITELEKKCFTIPWSEYSFREELKNPCACYIVAEDNGHIAGYGGMWIVLDEAYITNIAVEHQQRRRGLGRDILKWLLSDAMAQGVTAITLEVRTSNVPAIALYESFGFIKCGLRKGYYIDNNEDAIIMKKELNKA
ncbi:MAG: ribosomal protein S18-alanine N-acetyltransferase [Christensenellales bacterium]